MPRHATSCHTRNITPHHVMPCHITSLLTTALPFQATLCFVILSSSTCNMAIRVPPCHPSPSLTPRQVKHRPTHGPAPPRLAPPRPATVAFCIPTNCALLPPPPLSTTCTLVSRLPAPPLPHYVPPVAPQSPPSTPLRPSHSARSRCRSRGRRCSTATTTWGGG